MPDHFYTVNEAEGNKYEQLGYTFEGYPGYVYPNPLPFNPDGSTALSGNLVAIYRFYNSSTHDNFYCQDPNGETAKQNGYVSKGIAWWMYSVPVSFSVALYRYVGNDDHLYITDQMGEGQDPDYGYEKILGYLLTLPLGNCVKLLRYYEGDTDKNIVPPEPCSVGPYLPGANQLHFTGYLPTPRSDNDNFYNPGWRGPTPRSRFLSFDPHPGTIPFDQLDYSSCVANAVAAALVHGSNMERVQDISGQCFSPSRLWLYWIARFAGAVGEQASRQEVQKFLTWQAGRGGNATDHVMGVSGTTSAKTYEDIRQDLTKDDGSRADTMMHALTHLGVCPEDDWAYKNNLDISRVPKGPDELEIAAKYDNRQLEFYRIKDLHDDNAIDLMDSVERAIMDGYPVIMGMWYPDNTRLKDLVSSPWLFDHLCGPGDKRSGHQVLAVGYDRTDSDNKKVKILNSWGPGWGENGYFYVPYDRFSAVKGKGWYDNGDELRYQMDEFWVVKVKPKLTSAKKLTILKPTGIITN